MKLLARRFTFSFPRPALVMGIVNLGTDSFSGDGLADPALAVAHARRLVEDGAEIIDVGAESARTNRGPIGVDEEVARLRAFLEHWAREGDPQVALSINTWRPDVVKEVLPLGGDLLNDLSGLPASGENARLCAEHGAALLIMHTVGVPKVAHTAERYSDVMEALERFFEGKLRIAETAGLPRDAVLLDPGIDFAKQREDNLRVYREIGRLHAFGRPILLPVSRKTVIGDVLGIAEPAERDAGTVACIVQGLREGVQIFRVHRVRAAVQAIRTIEAVARGSLAAKAGAP